MTSMRETGVMANHFACMAYHKGDLFSLCRNCVAQVATNRAWELTVVEPANPSCEKCGADIRPGGVDLPIGSTMEKEEAEFAARRRVVVGIKNV